MLNELQAFPDEWLVLYSSLLGMLTLLYSGVTLVEYLLKRKGV